MVSDSYDAPYGLFYGNMQRTLREPRLTKQVDNFIVIPVFSDWGFVKPTHTKKAWVCQTYFVVTKVLQDFSELCLFIFSACARVKKNIMRITVFIQTRSLVPKQMAKQVKDTFLIEILNRAYLNRAKLIRCESNPKCLIIMINK